MRPTSEKVSEVSPKERAIEGILWYLKHHGLSQGDRLPPERVLSVQLGVSRTALRSAISSLLFRHTLESRHGSGTYVCTPKPIDILQDSVSVLDVIRRAGMEPRSCVLMQKIIRADNGLAKNLCIGTGAEVFSLHRIRFANDKPISLEWIYISYALCPEIEAYDFNISDLHDVLEHRYGLRASHGFGRISLCALTENEAALLDEPKGAFAYCRTSTYETDGTDSYPLEHRNVILSPSRFRLASVTGDETVRKMVGPSWLMA